ncbi:MAG: glucose-1-phosphate thymidylyltransferase, partial [Bacteroidia bacterium]
INFTYDIFSKNGYQINEDFNLITTGRKSQTLSTSNTLIGENIFVEEGADVEAAVLNSKNGPIYIGKNATIMEGALIKGPFALGSSATIKMGAKIYGDTSVGPSCKVGGEVSNTLFYGNSNKGHDGFLGNSVIGEWCNLGADTNSSNLKNNYAQVKLWNYTKSRFVNSGLQFCGLIMADHSKCGINTMFNTGTVVGVSANIFGASFPRNFIPSFTWGGATGFATYSLGKAFETARIVMSRRQQELNETEKEILKNVHEISSTHRIWEKKTIKI